MTACKKLKRGKNITIEDLYQNKNFVPPKEKNLETIFEEPKQAKDGAPILTSVRKYKRYLDFDPITGKVLKPKKKGKRFVKKVKGKTRSASKTLQNIDISAVLETLNESSDECEMDLTIRVSECGDGDHISKDTVSVLPIEDKTVNNDIHMAKSSVSVLPIADKTVNGDHVTINNMTVHTIDDNTLNHGVLCKKCTLVEKLCSCKCVTLNKSKVESIQQEQNETDSSFKPCAVT